MILLKIVLAVIFLSLSANGQADTKNKRATLWGKEISYELVTINKKGFSYDGLSFVAQSQGKNQNRVVLNRAYFEKEASEIFKALEGSIKPSELGSPDLMSFYNRLSTIDHEMALGHHLNSSQTAGLINELSQLKDQLRHAAWSDLYQETKLSNSSVDKARKNFVKRFKEVRSKTIEYHELSHLIDQLQNAELSGAKKISLENEEYVRQTEVKAFLTEMVYGENPRDSLWQVISGVLHEMKRGENVDYSVRKLKDLLQAVKEMPWLAEGHEPKGNYLCFLCYLSREESRYLATVVYHSYHISKAVM